MAKTIVGYVRDNPGGAALSGKSVTLKDANTGLSVATGGQTNLIANPVTSDVNGRFSFTMDLVPGPLYVQADLGGGNNRVRYGAEIMQAGAIFVSDIPFLVRAFSTGVIANTLSLFATTASGVDRTITTQPGYANIMGSLFGWDTGNKALVGSAYAGAGTRWDLLVLRQWYNGASIGKQQMLIVEGTDATDPPVTSSEADLTKFIQGLNIWDFPIKRVKTPTGSSTVTLDDLVGSAAWPVSSVQDGTITNAKIVAGIAATKIGSGSVDNTEFSFLDGVTSGIQAQLDAKASIASLALLAPLASPVFTGTVTGAAMTLSGVVTMNGDVTIGNATSDVLTIQSRIVTAGSAPAAAANLAAGTGRAASVVYGDSTSGLLRVVTGGSGVAGGNFVTLTYFLNRPSANYTVFFIPANSAAQGIWQNMYVSALATSFFTLAINSAPAISTTYDFFYLVIG